MPATLTDKNIFVPFAKRNNEKRMVYGYASTEALDSDGEIIVHEAIKNALPDYMQIATVREMHHKWAAGKTKSAEMDDKGLYIGAKIVDDQAWEKVKEGVYTGFSLGGEVTSRLGNKITGFNLKEISLVDRPANPEAVIDSFKIEKPRVGLGPTKKGMGSLSRTAFIYQDIEFLLSEVLYEQQTEGDEDSKVASMLNEICEKLGEVLLAMAEEEISESQESRGMKMSEEIITKAKKEETKEEIAERKKALKEDLKARLKKAKDEMDEMEKDDAALDKEDLSKDDMDAIESKKGKKKEETKEEAKKEDLEKVDFKKLVVESIEKATKAKLEKAEKAAPAVDLSPIMATMQKMAEGIETLAKGLKVQTEKMEKLESFPLVPKTLKVVEKDGTVTKLEGLSEKELLEKVQKGEVSRSDAFKQALAEAPRSSF